MVTIISKIAPKKKRVWVKCIAPHHYEDFIKDGWKVYESSDSKCNDALMQPATLSMPDTSSTSIQ